MNIWDFGGQEIYHATHQFFLTKRSLYVLVNNTRSNTTDFNHWLQMIELWSDGSPVILVQNVVDGSDATLDIKGLKERFENIKEVLVSDLSKCDAAFLALKKEIFHQIQKLDHVGSELPKQWVVIREAIAELELKKPYIEVREFYDLCKKHKIPKREDAFAIEWFFCMIWVCFCIFKKINY